MVGLLAQGCSDSAPNETAPSTEGTPVVRAVNYPLKYFAERIGGAAVRVEYAIPSGVDPAYWKPDAVEIRAYQQADLILLNGAGYAKWIDRVSLPQAKLVDTSAGFAEQYIKLTDTVTHTHGPTGDHAHGDVAFSTWVDPILAIEQARATKAAMARLVPSRAQTFDENFATLKEDLLTLDSEMRKVAKQIRGRPLVVSHPVYQYWARRYGLNVISVHWEPDKAPDEKMWEELKTLLEDHPARTMVWEGKPLKKTAEKLKALGLDSVVFDPCGNVPDTRDFLSVMRQNVKNIEANLTVLD